MPRSVPICALLIAAVAAGCGGTSHAASPRYQAPVVFQPARTAPPFRLKDQFGHWVSLASLRGESVGVAFTYTHCKNECPLMLQELSAAHDAGAHMHVIAISVDPAGDTPAAVHRFLTQRDLMHEVEYLTGTRAQLAPIWKAYLISSRVMHVNGQRVVEHYAGIVGIDAGGTMRTAYPAAELDPQALEHDMRALAGTT